MASTKSHNKHDVQTLDLVLLVSLGTLIVFGLVMLASASIALAEHNTGDPLAIFKRQSWYVCLGLFAAFVAYRLPLSVWQFADKWLWGIALCLLLSLYIPGLGVRSNGALRWLDLGLVTVQVSEIAKLLIAMYLAGYLVRHRQNLREKSWAFVAPLMLVSVVAGVLVLEPDMGAAVVLMCLSLGMIFMAGVRLLPFISVLFTATGVLTALMFMESYRVRRLMSFLNPWESATGDGYQLIQSLIAIGSGSWFGVGLGGSVQKMHYLPEQSNDFLFAVLAEELGLVGVFLLLVLYAVVVVRGFQIGAAADMAEHKFGAYLAYGISLWIGLQALVNIGVNMGVLPTKGLILPFMSQGGSAMVVMCVAAALLLRVHYETQLTPQVVSRKMEGRR